MAKSLCTIAMRILAFSAALAACVVMATSNESVDLLNYTFEATYTDWPPLKYCVIANGIAACYGLLVLLLPSGSLLWRLVVPLDTIMLIIVATGCGVTGETIYYMKKGNLQAGWSPICDKVPAFCSHVVGALATAAIGTTAQLLMTLYSFHVIINPLLMQNP